MKGLKALNFKGVTFYKIFILKFQAMITPFKAKL